MAFENTALNKAGKTEIIDLSQSVQQANY